MNVNMIGLSKMCSPLFITLQVIRWGRQLLSLLAEYPSLYTDLEQATLGIEPMVMCYKTV